MIANISGSHSLETISLKGKESSIDESTIRELMSIGINEEDIKSLAIRIKAEDVTNDDYYDFSAMNFISAEDWLDDNGYPLDTPGIKTSEDIFIEEVKSMLDEREVTDVERRKRALILLSQLFSVEQNGRFSYIMPSVEVKKILPEA